MKERVEDLGRLREKLDQILDSEVFELASKYEDSFIAKYKSEENLADLCNQLRWLKESICGCYAIARGDDED